VIGGALIGIDRGEHGRAAGLRTTLLVCLAASLSMIQVNLLLSVAGKAPNSFVVMDLMRLPLGILSGMGFIGAGAILRRDNLVVGITTAATLWFVTVMGLCFGGGQIALGWIAVALGLIVLVGLKWVEDHWKQDCYAMLAIVTGPNAPTEDEIAKFFAAANYRIKFSSVIYGEGGTIQELVCQLRWRGHARETQAPPIVRELAVRFHLVKAVWRVYGKQ
jgi:putative Mg2+ transporter-C (MgtC) family protein